MILDVDKLLAPITVHEAIVRRHAETKAYAGMARRALEGYENRRDLLKASMKEVRESIRAIRREGRDLVPLPMILRYKLLMIRRKKNLQEMLRQKRYFFRQRRYLQTL